MLIQFSNKFNINSIRKIIKINNIKNTKNDIKVTLLDKLNKHKVTTYIQNYIRDKIRSEKNCLISYDKLKYPFVSFLR